MGRRPKYSRAAIVAAAREVVGREGVRGATIAAIARQLGAPSGSIYHRYRSRELLLAELWLTVVEDYQQRVLAELDREAPLEAAVAAALLMPRWVRANMADARLLLTHHREDFVAGQWPEEVVERAAALEPQLNGAIRVLCGRIHGPRRVSKARLLTVRFAVLDVPFGAVKRYVREGRKPPSLLDELIRRTCITLLQE